MLQTQPDRALYSQPAWPGYYFSPFPKSLWPSSVALPNLVMYLTFRHAENPPEASASVSPFFLYASIAVQFSNTSKSPPSMPSRFGLSSVGVLEECPQPERNMGGPIAHQDSLLDLMNQADLI